MIKKLLFLLSLIPSVAFSSGIYNPGSGGSSSLPLLPGDTNYIQNTNSLQSSSTFYVSSGTINGQFTVNSIPSSSFGNTSGRLKILMNNSTFANLHQMTATNDANSQPAEFDFKNQGSDGTLFNTWIMGNASSGQSLQIKDQGTIYEMEGVGDGRGETVILSSATGVINLPHNATLGVYGSSSLNHPIADFGSADGSGGLTSRMTIYHSSVTITGSLALNSNLQMVATATSPATVGVIYAGGNPFLHNWNGGNSTINNTYLGINSGALTSIQTFSNTGNVGVGAGTLLNESSGFDDIAIGYHAMGTGVVTGWQNEAIGSHSMENATSATNNAAVGWDSLQNCTGCANNEAFGTQALILNVSGSDNIAIGMGSLYHNVSGSQNIGLGTNTLASNISGINNVAIGYNVLSNSTASQLIAIGPSALAANTSGGSNVAIGVNAMAANTSGGTNSAYGSGSFQTNKTGTQNAAFGANSLDTAVSGDWSTAVGASALTYHTSGGHETGIGYSVGGTFSGPQDNTGHDNTYIGYQAGPGAGGQWTNATAIGADSVVNSSNCVVLGRVTDFVGIGTPSPASKLHLSSGIFTLDGSGLGIQVGPKIISSSCTVVISSSSTGLFSMTISTSGIVSYPSNPGISVTSCGTNPSVVGSNVGGTITVGTGVSVTACTLNFSPPFKNTPLDCVESDDNAAITGSVSSLSNTAATFSLAASLAGGHIYYHCDGND